MYHQINIDPSLRITVMDLIGGINPYVWRIEYCSVCNHVSRSLGPVPLEEIEHHKRANLRWAKSPP